MKRRKTNREVICDLIDFSDHGGLMQMFIVETLMQTAQRVADAEAAPDGWPNMISWEAWQGCANEIIADFDKHYGDKT